MIADLSPVVGPVAQPLDEVVHGGCREASFLTVLVAGVDRPARGIRIIRVAGVPAADAGRVSL
jgi:hypothetical protein